MIESALVKYSHMRELILMGDFNARTGVLNDYIYSDKPIPVDCDTGYIPDIQINKRQNKDDVVNKYGRTLTNIYKVLNLEF